MTRASLTRASLTWMMAAGMTAALGCVVAAAERIKADVSCRPGPKSLQYDCTIKLTDARTGAPLTKADLTVGAEMPSMPMAHNVRPVKATPSEEPGTFRARIELEMHGDWALQLNIAGDVHDRVIKTMRFEDDHAAERSAPNAPSPHRH
jgi:YtkA-like